jgi:hypothetical protein
MVSDSYPSEAPLLGATANYSVTRHPMKKKKRLASRGMGTSGLDGIGLSFLNKRVRTACWDLSLDDGIPLIANEDGSIWGV